MNILVTGATGFVGKHLVKDLKCCAHEVHILVRPSTDCSSINVSRIFTFNDNIEALAVYLRQEQIDGIIHLASLYVAEHKTEQIKPIIDSNLYLGTALLEAAKMAGVKWFLNTGTIWQNYNAPDYSDQYNPVNLYAASKQAFITVAKYYTETSPLRFCTLKLCDTYGADDTRRKIFTLFDEIAASGKELAMSPGKQQLDILHIDDVVSGFIQLAEMLQDDTVALREEYVLTSGQTYSLKEWAHLYEQRNNVHLNIQWGGRCYRQREVMKPYVGNVLPNWKANKQIINMLNKVIGGGKLALIIPLTPSLEPERRVA
ncbi:NAD-dependent epimerase/dehydratase family protein [Phocaeicola sartorii]|uniref:NAD-dependent epimerase/dehydratase family protein n=2 Tax=Phocaeicola sartorii TaxID=671267 RepID=UPI0025877A8C|nr:NAD-dependent epimerase/dehydratase family protein [Phocaeicola sartorii]